MSCFPCFSSQKSKKERDSPSKDFSKSGSVDARKSKPPALPEPKANDDGEQVNIKSQNFTFRELATATKNFRQECLLGEGGFGRVYRGTLQGSGQVVAVKQLDRNGLQHGSKEFLAEVAALSQLDHENLVKLVGYCADGDQRLLVYEFIPGGSLEDHLLDLGPDKKPLDWINRMKLAFGAAKGLEYLHETADPPIIYRNMKSSNILLDGDLIPKLSDFGMAKIGPSNDKFHGYCAPEYTGTGNLTLKSDVYSFGVVLLELISGRRAIDTTKPTEEQNLVAWAQPKFRDPKLYSQLADPLLGKNYPEKSLNQAVAIAAMCVQEEASVRPLMSDVSTTLSFLLSVPDEPARPPAGQPDVAPPSEKGDSDSDSGSGSGSGSSSHKNEDDDNNSDDGDSTEESSDEYDDEEESNNSGSSRSMSIDRSVSSSAGKSSRKLSSKKGTASHISSRKTSKKINASSKKSASSRHGNDSNLGPSNSKRSHDGGANNNGSSRKSSRGRYDGTHSSVGKNSSKVSSSLRDDPASSDGGSVSSGHSSRRRRSSRKHSRKRTQTKGSVDGSSSLGSSRCNSGVELEVES